MRRQREEAIKEGTESINTSLAIISPSVKRQVLTDVQVTEWVFENLDIRPTARLAFMLPPSVAVTS